MILVLYCSSTTMITIMKNIIRLHPYLTNGCIGDTYFHTKYILNRRAYCDTYLEGLLGIEKGHGMMFHVPKEHRKKCKGHLWMAIPPNVHYGFLLEVHPCQPCQTDYEQEWTDDMFYGIVTKVIV